MNRCLAEGRERFRRLLHDSATGSRCADLSPLLSAWCDGEASATDAVVVREHLRACTACRATTRAYRATPGAVAALAPALPITRSLLQRAQEMVFGLHARLFGAGEASDAGMAQVAAAGGTRGAGMAALAKVLAVCAGTVGGAACIATGVAPVPLDLRPQQTEEATIERVSERADGESTTPTVVYQPTPTPEPPQAPTPEPKPEPKPAEALPEGGETGAVEYTAPPSAEPAPATATAASSASSSESAAGEFGP